MMQIKASFNDTSKVILHAEMNVQERNYLRWQNDGKTQFLGKMQKDLYSNDKI